MIETLGLVNRLNKTPPFPSHFVPGLHHPHLRSGEAVPGDGRGSPPPRPPARPPHRLPGCGGRRGPRPAGSPAKVKAFLRTRLGDEPPVSQTSWLLLLLRPSGESVISHLGYSSF